MRISLNGSDWTVSGWARHQWQYGLVMETGGTSLPQIRAIPSTVPGAVQADLRRAGFLPDWNLDFNFRQLDWVEHREWMYEKRFTAPEAKADRRFLFCFEGLDFSGFIYLNGERIGEFCGMHLPVWVDASHKILPGEENSLRVVFLQPPEVDGQIGFTSETTVLKSRYNYGWDWMPRMVNIGIFRDVWLHVVDGARCTNVYPKAAIEDGQGIVTVNAEISADRSMKALLKCRIRRDGSILSQKSVKIAPGADGPSSVSLRLQIDSPELWQVLPSIRQPLYDVETELCDESGAIIDAHNHRVGFRTMTYEQPVGAHPDALPYSIRVNGKLVPIRGVDWVPLSPFYGTVTEANYRYILGQFQKMHTNMIRVWGGALLESETFYNICDELGILVWQEFPQSSSGIDNTPCEEPEFIGRLAEVAKEFIVERRHHACLAVWCAGNELYHPDYRPVNFDLANIRVLAAVAEENDPDRLYLPGSPSGPSVHWNQSISVPYFGDTHGPWNYGGPHGHYDQFNRDTSLLHSEVGTPASPREETLRSTCSLPLWPPTIENPLWLARGAWWISDRQLTELFGPFDGHQRGLTEYIKAFRYMQMESLRYVASIIRRAGNKKAGLIVWMGNEPFPNIANTSLIEYDGCPKPAFYAMQRAFAPSMLALAYDSVVMKKRISAELFGCADENTEVRNIRAAAYDENGTFLGEQIFDNSILTRTTEFGRIELPAGSMLTLVRLTGETDEGLLCEEYIFTPSQNEPFRTLIDVPKPSLTLTRLAEDQYILENSGTVPAFCIDCIGKAADGRPLVVYGSYRTLLAGERLTLTTPEPCAEMDVQAMGI